MKTIKFILLLLVMTAFPVSMLFTQSMDRSILGSAGQQNQVGTQQIEWTIGETISNYFQNGSIVISTGFHQGEVAIIDNIPTPIDNRFSLQIFPNPARDFIKIVNPPIQLEKLKIFDAAGQLVWKSSVAKDIIQISQLSTGTYSLQAITNSGLVVTQLFIKL